MRLLTILLTLGLLATGPVAAQDSEGIDPEALIDRILKVYHDQRAKLSTVTLDAVYAEGEMKDDEGFVEKERFEKKIYLKYLEDTVLYHEQYVAYYKDDELQEEKKLREAARDRQKKKRDRKAYDISYPMLKPFFPETRATYTITYDGTAEEPSEGFLCHVFTVKANEEVDTLLEGQWYFDSETFHLARVEFAPARLVKKTMFKLNKLDMTLLQAPAAEGIWLPRRFELVGKGKAAFLFGVSFAGQEYYRNPQINVEIPDSLFVEETNDD
ncbi:hypothetical protein GF420_13625 [candidate division GN15 bacterium]|nr:hypothetical protein [candidate division GN15 bacterium]